MRKLVQHTLFQLRFREVHMRIGADAAVPPSGCRGLVFMQVSLQEAHLMRLVGVFIVHCAAVKPLRVDHG